MMSRTTRPAIPALRLEELEAREVPAVVIQIDYSRDTSGLFNNAEARATLEAAASQLGNSLNANLAAITPGGGNTWTATFIDPASGGQMSVSNLAIGANTIKVFVGARSLGSSEAGFGGYGGYSISGTQSWLNTVQTRGHSGFAMWGGSVTFDSNQNWYFGQDANGLASNKLDFYSVAVHELGHVLGIGTAPQWRNLLSGGAFRGGSAMNVYGGAVPVSGAGDHWADGLTVNGQAVSLDPSLPYGQRVGFTSLDAAALNDLGWNAAPAASSPSAGPSGVILFAMAGTNGRVIQYAIVNGAVFATGTQFVPFPGYAGTLNQAFGDFDNDGVYDLAVATTGRGPALVAVISGLDGRYIGGPRVALGGVTFMIGFDVENDGQLDLVTLEGTPSGIYVYDVTGGAIAPDAAFSAFGAPGRAALTAAGELDRTGYGDAVSRDAPSAPAAVYAAADPWEEDEDLGFAIPVA